MDFPEGKRGLRAARLAGAAVLLVIAACGTPRAPEVDCDGRLRPVNAPPERAGALSGRAAPAGAERHS